MTTPTLKQRAERLREALIWKPRWNGEYTPSPYSVSDIQTVIKAAETLLRLMEGFPGKCEELQPPGRWFNGFNACRAEVLNIIEGER